MNININLAPLAAAASTAARASTPVVKELAKEGGKAAVQTAASLVAMVATLSALSAASRLKKKWSATRTAKKAAADHAAREAAPYYDEMGNLQNGTPAKPASQAGYPPPSADEIEEPSPLDSHQMREWDLPRAA